MRKEILRIIHGITPAYAGKREGPKYAQSTVGDHPRVCGEKRALSRSCAACGEKSQSTSASPRALGSPPRMRGKGVKQSNSRIRMGITPAYAGKRFLCNGNCFLLRDHPRVCGEKERTSRCSCWTEGSPPRMRGKVSFLDCCSKSSRITPAYAGKRLKRSHRIGHFSCILCLFHSVLHRASASGGSRAGPCAPPCLPAQNAVPV